MKRNSKLCVCVSVAIFIILMMLMMNRGGSGSLLEGAKGGKEEKKEEEKKEVEHKVPEIPDLKTLLNGVDLDMSSVMKVAESLKTKE